jgi:ABC-2 type transport system permease protein
MSSAEPGATATPQAGGTGTPRAGGTGTLLASELRLIFRRRRTWALFAALAAIPILIAVAVRVTNASGGPAFVDRISSNGFFVAVAALTVCIPLFLPLTVAVVAGDGIAGEAQAGTLRYLLAAPAGRIRLLLVKFVGSVAFALAGTLVVVVVGAIMGAVLFGFGPVTLLSGTTVSVPEGLGRAALVGLYATLSLVSVAAIGLFFSTLTDAPIGAIAATALLAVVSEVLDQLEQVAWLHPWLFTHQWLNFGGLVTDPIAWGAFGENALLQVGYTVVFGLLAWARFTTKDVLS